jgi:uncharacterized membrane protein YebE (DUF533 family)
MSIRKLLNQFLGAGNATRGAGDSLGQLSRSIQSMEQKTELYLASCLVIDPDHPAEQTHLDQLAQALYLPQDLAQQLQQQAQQALTRAV